MNFRSAVLCAGLAAGVITLSDAALSHEPLPVGCSEVTPEGCAYVPLNAFSGIQQFDMTLRDPARGNYRVPIRVRFAGDSVGPRPVVIMNHGGAINENGKASLSEWSEKLVEDGFIVIHPSRVRVRNPTAGELAICKLNKQSVDPDKCGVFLGAMIYGPRNTDFIISRFSDIQARLQVVDDETNATLDATRVIVGGWSGGSSIVLANAGAWRRFDPEGPKVTNQISLLPIGFFGLSTMGPDYAGFGAGFQSESYNDIDERPFLTITGKGDNHGKTSEARTTAFMRAEPEGKFLSWDTNPVLDHPHMAHQECGPGADLLLQSHCAFYESALLAFVDWVAYGHPAAADWLDSDAYLTLTGGEVELHHRVGEEP